MSKRTALLAFVFAGLPLLGASPSESAIISVGPYTVPAVQGQPFLVPIQITGAVELVSWSFGLTYDPTDLQVNDPPALDPFFYTTEGPFYASGAPFNLLIPGVIALDNVTNLQIGSLFGVEGAYGGIPPAPSGDGILAFVEFVAIGEGTSIIDVVDESTVSGVVPEPTTIALLLGGLLLLGTPLIDPEAASRLLKHRRNAAAFRPGESVVLRVVFVGSAADCPSP